MKTDVWREYPADCKTCRYAISMPNGLFWCARRYIIIMDANIKYFKDCPYYEKVKVKAEK